jgi:predicted outer membrane protein
MKLRTAAAGLLGSMAVLASVGMGSAGAQTAGVSEKLSQQDQTFLTQNAQTDQAEITTGQLAAQRGTTDEIRQTGQTLMSDHQQALSKVQGIAQRANVTLPNSPDSAQQQQAEQLKSASGQDFDRAYLQNEIKGHQTSINQTQQEISSGSDQQVIDFAKSYLQTAQQHLQLLQQRSNTMNSNGANNSNKPNNSNRPSGVNAGSGGEAASSGMSPVLVDGLAAGGVLVVLSSGGMVLARRRQE